MDKERGLRTKDRRFTSLLEEPAWVNNPPGRIEAMYVAAVMVDKYNEEYLKRGGVENPNRGHARFVTKTDMETHQIDIAFQNPVDPEDIQAIADEVATVSHIRTPKDEVRGNLLSKIEETYFFKPKWSVRKGGKAYASPKATYRDLSELRKVLSVSSPDFSSVERPQAA